MSRQKTFVLMMIRVFFIIAFFVSAFFLLRMLFFGLLEGIFGPPRNELLETSIYSQLTTTCFDDDTLESCEDVSIDIIRERIQPELDKQGLTFIDYFNQDHGKLGEIIDLLNYEIPEQYDRATYLYVDFHVLIAKDFSGEERIVVVPFEVVIDSIYKAFHSEHYSLLKYEDMITLLRTHFGESIIFDHQIQSGLMHTFKIELSEVMFDYPKYVNLDYQDKIELMTETSLYIKVDDDWVPYEGTYRTGRVSIRIIYNQNMLTIKIGRAHV